MIARWQKVVGKMSSVRLQLEATSSKKLGDEHEIQKNEIQQHADFPPHNLRAFKPAEVVPYPLHAVTDFAPDYIRVFKLVFLPHLIARARDGNPYTGVGKIPTQTGLGMICIGFFLNLRVSRLSATFLLK